MYLTIKANLPAIYSHRVNQFSVIFLALILKNHVFDPIWPDSWKTSEYITTVGEKHWVKTTIRITLNQAINIQAFSWFCEMKYYSDYGKINKDWISWWNYEHLIKTYFFADQLCNLIILCNIHYTKHTFE